MKKISKIFNFSISEITVKRASSRENALTAIIEALRLEREHDQRNTSMAEKSGSTKND